MVKRTAIFRVVARTVGVAAALVGAALATGCASIPDSAWQNGRALTSSAIIYGDHSFNGRAAYRSYVQDNALGEHSMAPSSLMPTISHMYR